MKEAVRAARPHRVLWEAVVEPQAWDLVTGAEGAQGHGSAAQEVRFFGR